MSQEQPQLPDSLPELPAPPVDGATSAVGGAQEPAAAVSMPAELPALPQPLAAVSEPPRPPIPNFPRPALRPGMAGRRYGFLCTYCSSRLEAIESMAGQKGTCPTCGNSIVIPILDYKGRLIDPTSGEIIKQDPHPVHAYAAAGHKAPAIIAVEGTDERYIKCPRCARKNNLSANNCLGCGLPFTMEGTVGDAVAGTNTWAVASLVLGIVSVPGACFIVPPILAIVFGVIGLRQRNQTTGQVSGAGLAIAGVTLGSLALLGGGAFWVYNIFH